MYRPRISQLIDELERVKAHHGDIEVVGYDQGRDVTFDEIGAEFNDDEGTFCLVTLEELSE